MREELMWENEEQYKYRKLTDENERKIIIRVYILYIHNIYIVDCVDDGAIFCFNDKERQKLHMKNIHCMNKMKTCIQSYKFSYI